MNQKSANKKQLIVGAILLALTICWCMATGRVIYFTGDYMIGFNPLLLSLLPFAGIVGLATIIGCVLKKWRFAIVASVCVVILIAFILNMYRIEPWAWSRSICQYDQANQEAINNCTAIPELTDDTLPENLWKDEALPVLQGFKWYSNHHLASPNRTFRVFRYHGIVHIRIQKVRHGYRGIAFLPRSADKEKIEKSTQITYQSNGPVKDHG